MKSGRPAQEWKGSRLGSIRWGLGTMVGLGALMVLVSASPAREARGGEEGFYPLGIYGVSTKEDLKFAKQLGFSIVRSPLDGELLDAAEGLGLWVLATPGAQATDDFPRAEVARAVGRFDSHPALWAWYLVDEPSFNRVSPTVVKEASDWIRAVGARSPLALVMYRARDAGAYVSSTDILMVNRYPIPWMPIANFGKNVRMGRLAAGEGRPLIAVVQAFNWRYAGTRFSGESGLRAPTYDELRCMVYLALVEGADGIFFYSLRSGDEWDLRDQPGTLAALELVVSEIRRYQPLFEADRKWWPEYQAYSDWENRFNEALEASVATRLLEVDQGNAHVPSGDYLVCVNSTPNAQGFSVTLPDETAGRIPVLGDSASTLEAKDGWLSTRLGPYGVRLIGPLNPVDATKAEPDHESERN